MLDGVPPEFGPEPEFGRQGFGPFGLLPCAAVEFGFEVDPVFGLPPGLLVPAPGVDVSDGGVVVDADGVAVAGHGVAVPGMLFVPAGVFGCV